MRNLRQFIEIADASGTETIWTCCVTCLGHLAALCHFISQTEPTLRSSMDSLCDFALDRLGNLSHEAHIEEFTYFDALTGVRILVALLQMSEALIEDTNQISWRRALNTIDVRIGSLPHDESGRLRHWRGVIEKAYADFQTNPLGYGPTLVISLAISMDGREGDSSFPNLLVAEGREPYGL